ncbi:LacI family DNA-binding transcriptional regulator, partial [Salmonella sp. E404]
MTPRKPTLHDVAAAAGVSIAAASFALRDKPGVSLETR